MLRFTTLLVLLGLAGSAWCSDKPDEATLKARLDRFQQLTPE